ASILRSSMTAAALSAGRGSAERDRRRATDPSATAATAAAPSARVAERHNPPARATAASSHGARFRWTRFVTRSTDRPRRCAVARAVHCTAVSTAGLESSPVAAALAGLRANEARYFKNKYDHVFAVEPANKAKKTVDWVHRILKEERDIVIASRPLEATEF